ncbi:uncharacterized protein LOC135938634 [Cloeon dipterum]|uniref:uncharacterized protein LOC135938634 n=1 Tax=Cloeon dipterum TaxID=197152 RepID=UPI0032208DD3
MVGCCVVGCGRNSSKPTVDTRYRNYERNVTFHQFPADTQIRNKWISAVIIGGRVEEWQPGTNTKICSLHFNLKDIKFNERGTQILKGAVPDIPLATKKKPPRRNKAAMVKAYKNLVDDICSEEIGAVEEVLTSELSKGVELTVFNDVAQIDFDQGLLDLTNVVFDPDTPGTSSEYSFPPSPEQMEVEVEQQNAKTKKVVKSANVHTFEAPANSTENTADNDLCFSLYGEILGKMKKLNIAVSKHHPDKSMEMQKMLDSFTKLFVDKGNMPDSASTLMHENDPFMPSNTEGEKFDTLFEEDFFATVLENPEMFLS